MLAVSRLSKRWRDFFKMLDHAVLQGEALKSEQTGTYASPAALPGGFRGDRKSTIC